MARKNLIIILEWKSLTGPHGRAALCPYRVSDQEMSRGFGKSNDVTPCEALAIVIAFFAFIVFMTYKSPPPNNEFSIPPKSLQGTKIGKWISLVDCVDAPQGILKHHRRITDCIFLDGDRHTFKEHARVFREKYDALVRLGQPPLPDGFDAVVDRIAMSTSDPPKGDDVNVFLTYLWALHSGSVMDCDFYKGVRALYLDEVRREMLSTAN